LFKEIKKIPKKTGFVCERKRHDDFEFIYWLLSSQTRHFWRHHYLGTQGIIFVFSWKNENSSFSGKLATEMINVLMDKNLIDVPSLVIFDKNLNSEEDLEIISHLRSLLDKGAHIYNTQFINFSEEEGIKEINFGLEWLNTVMKPIN
jgi:hypothetical protein